MRNMAYGVTISKIDDIKGKDKIGLAHFKENLYTVIVPKTTKVGDVLCYFEVDSILPQIEKFEFLRKRCYNERLNGFLIRKMKMGGVYSYGLTMSSEDLGMPIKAGEVYDEVLGVRKDEDRYDASPKTFKNGKLIRSREFPTDLIPKSDEDNVLNNPSLYDEVLKNTYWVSVKLEGKSMTVYLGKRTVADIFKTLKAEYGKVVNAVKTKNPHFIVDQIFQFARKLLDKDIYKIGEELRVFGRNTEGDSEMFEFAQRLLPYLKTHPNMVLQGEFTSPKVQKGIYKNGTKFNLYRIRENGTEFSPLEIDDVAKTLLIMGVNDVPSVEYLDVDLRSLSKDSSDLEGVQKFVDNLKFKEGSSKLDLEGDKLHEGIVIRNADMSIHFKIKNRDYEL